MTRGARQTLVGPPRAPCALAAPDPIDLYLGVVRGLDLGPCPALEPGASSSQERAAREGGQKAVAAAGCWRRLYAAQGGGAAGARAFPRSAANLLPGPDKAQDPEPAGLG